MTAAAPAADRPTVGVFIPSYNAARFVARAIRSVLAQTYAQLELVVLDDASTDDTADVVAPFLDDPRVRYVRHPANLGMARNWNAGIASLATPLICKLDADDWYEPNFLAAAVDALEARPDAAFAFGGLRWVVAPDGDPDAADVRVTEMRPYRRAWCVDGRQLRRNLARQCLIYGPTVCVRRWAYEQHGDFLETLRIHCDWEMWMRLSAHHPVAYLDATVASALRHAENQTTAAARNAAVPRDLHRWLDLLDAGALPYALTPAERRDLESAMAKLVVGYLDRALRDDVAVTAEAALTFLLRTRVVPRWERPRLVAARAAVRRLGARRA
ncbi:MAG: glycosyltransferase, partial [Acidobacteriota bacterium]